MPARRDSDILHLLERLNNVYNNIYGMYKHIEGLIEINEGVIVIFTGNCNECCAFIMGLLCAYQVD